MVQVRRLDQKVNGIKNLESGQLGTVVDTLSEQFTVEYENGKLGFLFYRDKNVVWKEVV